MSHIVIGSTGQVGGYLVKYLESQGETVFSKNRKDGTIDLTKYNRVYEALSKHKDDNVNQIWVPAAFTNVNVCEDNPKLCYETNVLGLQRVVESALNIFKEDLFKAHPRIILYSTDYLFSGGWIKGDSGPYQENSYTHPLSEYGHSKLKAEHLLLSTYPNPLIIRTCWVYSMEINGLGKNFVESMVRANSDGSLSKWLVPSNVYSCPTYAPDLAMASVEFEKTNCSNKVVNICGPEVMSKYQFATKTSKVLELSIPSETTEVSNQIRPLKSGLTTNVLSSVCPDVKMRTLEEGLSDIKENYLIRNIIT